MITNKVALNSIQPNVETNMASTAGNSKNIQTQITNKEQRLDSLSSDTKLSAAEKEKKRRELQKEIDELNRKLELMRMKQEEETKKAVKKQEQEAVTNEQNVETASKDSQPEASQKPVEEVKPAKISVEDVQKMLSAEHIVQKEQVQNNIDSRKEGIVNVLEAEIKQDELYGKDTAVKEEEVIAISDKGNFWRDRTIHAKETQDAAVIKANTKVIIGEI